MLEPLDGQDEIKAFEEKQKGIAWHRKSNCGAKALTCEGTQQNRRGPVGSRSAGLSGSISSARLSEILAVSRPNLIVNTRYKDQQCTAIALPRDTTNNDAVDAAKRVDFLAIGVLRYAAGFTLRVLETTKN